MQHRRKEPILHGLRYLIPEVSFVAEHIAQKQEYLDYKATTEWYERVEKWTKDEIARQAAWARDPSSRHELDAKRPSAAHLIRCARALLGCNDRFYLLTGLLGRMDALHPWLFDRCREVEEDPDGYIDLWSRFHYKSTIITFAGAIQEIVRDPEIKIAIFSAVKPIATEFLAQIKEELETNDLLKATYADVFYGDPKKKDHVEGRPAKWGTARGITVKRKSNPKEATIEAHGLLDGQPTSRHFDLHIYDDIVTQDYLTEESIKKTTLRWEMADNLGSHLGVRKWMPGTRYHFADTYSVIIDRKSLKARVYPATDNGKLDGKPVFLTPERWDEIKRDQRSTVSAQCLLNPMAGNEATFSTQYLRHYDVYPAVMNVYILVDPSKGTGERSDRTAIAVIGMDQGGSLYLLDGVCHRMKLSDRWDYVKQFRDRWENHPGVQTVQVGWERYGKDVELEVIETMQQRENNYFKIEELNTPRQGGHSKVDRIERLEPAFRLGRFLLPCVIQHPDHGLCYWAVWNEEMQKGAEAKGYKHTNNIGDVFYRKVLGETKRQQNCRQTLQVHRIVTPIKRLDENNIPYDVTRTLIDEFRRHPFAAHDDMIDATSRIYDIDPVAPIQYEASSTEPIGVEGEMLDGAA